MVSLSSSTMSQPDYLLANINNRSSEVKSLLKQKNVSTSVFKTYNQDLEMFKDAFQCLGSHHPVIKKALEEFSSQMDKLSRKVNDIGPRLLIWKPEYDYTNALNLNRYANQRFSQPEEYALKQSLGQALQVKSQWDEYCEKQRQRTSQLQITYNSSDQEADWNVVEQPAQSSGCILL